MNRPDDDQIQALADKASDIINTGTTRFRGMTYEEGIRKALEWVLGNAEETPLED